MNIYIIGKGVPAEWTSALSKLHDPSYHRKIVFSFVSLEEVKDLFQFIRQRMRGEFVYYVRDDVDAAQHERAVAESSVMPSTVFGFIVARPEFSVWHVKRAKATLVWGMSRQHVAMAV